MRRIPTHHRFSQWDGSQSSGQNPDDILGALADDLMEYGDLRWAMRNMLSRGMKIPQGGSMQGLRDMLRKMRQQKKQQLERYDLSSIFDGFKERLDEIVDMERARIDQWLDKDPNENDFSGDVLKNIAKNNKEQLDALPDDVAGRIRTLEKYEFLNPDAQKQFLELLNELRKAMTNTFFTANHEVQFYFDADPNQDFTDFDTFRDGEHVATFTTVRNMASQIGTIGTFINSAKLTWSKDFTYIDGKTYNFKDLVPGGITVHILTNFVPIVDGSGNPVVVMHPQLDGAPTIMFPFSGTGIHQAPQLSDVVGPGKKNKP